MGTLVRSHGWSKATSPAAEKATGLLSDGTRVAMVLDVNQTGVTGDGGDNTGVPKAYFYTSPNGTTWTLRATINISVLPSGTIRPMGSMSIGANNNIHFAYRDSTDAIKYHLLTFSSGPTYSVGSAETVFASTPANETHARLDIDVAGTGNNAIVAVTVNRKVATKSFKLNSAIRTNTPSWVALTQQTLIANDFAAAWTDEISIACDQSAIAGDNLTTAAVLVCKKSYGGVDTGDSLYLIKANVSTGATVSFIKQFGSMNVGLGGGFRKVKIFNIGVDTWATGSVLNFDPYRMQVSSFSINRSTMAYTQITAFTIREQGTADRTLDPFSWTSQAWVGNGKIVFTRRNTTYRVVTVATMNTDGSVTWSSASNFEMTYLAPGGVLASQMWMGTPRHYSSSILPYMSAYLVNGSNNSYRVEWTEKVNPSAGTVVTPGAGATVLTDTPTLKGTHKFSVNTPPFRTKLQFDLATDSGFTTNLRTVTEPDEDLIYAVGTAGATIVTSEETVPAISELFSQTWFIRVRAIDELGAAGAYSPSLSFSTGHPPVGANLYPTAGKIFVYGTGAITFSWDFTDPAPSDFQTAYQIVITNADTGAVVLDTTKVVSSAKSASPTIPVGSKDTDLLWTLTLWDSDDTAGPASTPQQFSVTDSPTPAITSPTPSQVLAAANPIITWTSGIVGIKTQTEFRVVVYRSASAVFDSGWKSGSDTAYQVPTGYLLNNTFYTVVVFVKDNYNLTAQASQNFSTTWTAPATRSLQSVYLSQYPRQGFVYLTIDPTGFDVDFLAWNIYRRKYGEVDFTLIASLTKTSDIVAYRDYSALAGVKYQYAITQLADRFGDYIESSLSSSTIFTVTPLSESYWILDELEPELSVPLFQVSSDDFEEEFEEATYTVIGRGRHVDYGDRFGYTGSLKCQLRPRVVGGVEKTNWVINPSLSYSDPGPTPNSWTLATTGTVGTVTEDFIQTQDPSPSQIDKVYRVNASGLGTAVTDAIIVSQLIVLDSSIVVNDVCTWSIWVNDVQGVITQRRLEIGIRWETAGSVLVRDDLVQSPASIETYTSSAAGTPDFGNTTNAVTGQWKRYSISGAMPATATQVRVRIQLEGTATGTAASRDLVIAAGQFEKSTAATPYFDGRRLGGVWLGTEDLSPSYTSGYYTARDQRLALEQLKAQKASFMLRNPFGDFTRVAFGNISVSRIAGTGQTEITDVTIPYQEVAF